MLSLARHKYLAISQNQQVSWKDSFDQIVVLVTGHISNQAEVHTNPSRTHTKLKKKKKNKQMDNSKVYDIRLSPQRAKRSLCMYGFRNPVRQANYDDPCGSQGVHIASQARLPPSCQEGSTSLHQGILPPTSQTLSQRLNRNLSTACAVSKSTATTIETGRWLICMIRKSSSGSPVSQVYTCPALGNERDAGCAWRGRTITYRHWCPG